MTATEERSTARHPAEVPLYTPLDAARHLRAPLWVVAEYFGRHPFEYPGRFGYPPFLPTWDVEQFPPDYWEGRDSVRIDFRTLAELFVRFTAVRAYFSAPEPDRPSRPREWRDRYAAAVTWLRDRIAVTFDDAPLDERVDSIIARARVNRDDALDALLRKWLTITLGRVEVVGGVPVRFFPLTREPSPDAPRVVSLDPLVRFGRPTVRATPTDMLSDRFQAGDSV